ncbi:DMT family transporter [Amycolatopsis sp. NPDC059090]|uniref:DMT family transporter n=1 Tax=unclassified Amycolatopsis TaxID=2618356 RepID=UPI00366BB966
MAGGRSSGSGHRRGNRAAVGGWTALMAAAVFEIAFALGTGESRGFTRLVPSAIAVVAAALSMFLLSVALKQIDLGSGYAVWTGLGSGGTLVFGSVLFGDSLTLVKCVCIAAIIGGVIGLKVISGDGSVAASRRNRPPASERRVPPS